MASVVVLLNVLSTVFLTVAIGFIVKKNVRRHRQFIVLALGTAVILIGVFLYDKIILSDSLKGYLSEGLTGSLGFRIFLGSHIFASVITIPLIIVTLKCAYKKQTDLHMMWAKRTAAIWYYASVTGVMLFSQLG